MNKIIENIYVWNENCTLAGQVYKGTKTDEELEEFNDVHLHSSGTKEDIRERMLEDYGKDLKTLGMYRWRCAQNILNYISWPHKESY